MRDGLEVAVILPASNEAGYIGACLDALLASTASESAPHAIGRVRVIVAANACRDATVAEARARVAAAAARGWTLEVLEIAEPGKLNALNMAERKLPATIRIYLDADVRVSPPLLGLIVEALDVDAPRWASGKPVIARARSPFTRAYARFWQRLPFLTHGVPGFGIFAVNAAGRARWGAFPEIISDDTFVRLHFSPAERFCVAASYEWPLVEGFRRLVRVRRRQDAGVRQVRALHPHLAAQEDTAPPDTAAKLRLLLRDPVGFGVYAAVAMAVALRPASGQDWTRGR